MVVVKIETNIEEVISALERLGANIDGIEGEILQDVARMMFDKAQETCPSPTSIAYPTKSTGFLRDSHTLVPLGVNAMKITPTAYYAVFVHEGTVNMAARPWLQNAVDMVKYEANRYVQDKLVALLSK